VVVDLACGFGVDWKGTASHFGIHGYQFGAAAADDSDGGGRGEREEVFRRYGGGQCAEVFLTVL
jgi:hypothetical protein